VKSIITLLFFFIIGSSSAQSFFEVPDSLNKKRLKGVVITETVGTLGSMYGLNKMWYSQYPRSSFHLFNDNAEWLQMDKAGHSITAYYIGYAGIQALKWTGVDRKKAIWFGGGLGFIYQSGFEMLDAFSVGWGFSIGDMIANGSGTALVISQELMWDEQRVKLKFSAHQTNFADFRPNVLGSSFSERLLKDYNGQTYWLSFNIKSFAFKETKFPSWLSVAVGYSASEMISGTPDSDLYCNGDSWCIGLDRYRQWYVSLDADLTKIKTKSNLLKTIFGTFGFIKIPAPAIEFSRKGTKLKGFYF